MVNLLRNLAGAYELDEKFRSTHDGCMHQRFGSRRAVRQF
jgi:hypothetical protein